jgi:hypothetical protein
MTDLLPSSCAQSQDPPAQVRTESSFRRAA